MKRRVILALMIVGTLIGVGAGIGSVLTANSAVAGCSSKC